MKLSILGGCGGWPTATQPCSGYLVEHAGFRLLIDPGYGVLPLLLDRVDVGEVDAVFVSHGHPDHCADLNPLLRARVLGGATCDPLPVYAPAGALDRVLDLDQIRSVRRGAEVITLDDGSSMEVGPFVLESAALPHHVTNLGLRLSADDEVFVYTGDSGHCAARTALSKDADVLLAEASYAREVPYEDAPYLSTARQVAETAAEADVLLTLLTHLLPGEDSADALAVARADWSGDVEWAVPRLDVDLSVVGAGPPPRRALAVPQTAANPSNGPAATYRPRRASSGARAVRSFL